MTDTNTLAPCPFCGERAETDFIPEHHSYQIECSDSIVCTARITRDSELGAIEAWNCRAALAAPAQPVAWALQWPDDSRLNISTVFDTQLEATDYLKSCSDGVVVVPLYAAPQQAAHLAAKWQLVPRQLTQDMAEAAKFVDGRLSVFKYADAYRAMLYAAPQPAAQDAPVDAERWLDLLAEARAALWQPANAALCERLDAFIDAARAAQGDT